MEETGVLGNSERDSLVSEGQPCVSGFDDWLSVVPREAFRLFWDRGSLGLSFPGERNHTSLGSGLAPVVHPLQDWDGFSVCYFMLPGPDVSAAGVCGQGKEDNLRSPSH